MARVVLGLIVWLSCARPALDQTGATTVIVSPSGHYEVRYRAPDFIFGGDVGQPLTSIRSTDGQDAIGAFHAVDFDYGARTSGVRAYRDAPVVLFTTTYTQGGQNAEPFPVLSTLPSLQYRLSYRDTPFSPYQLNSLVDASDSPWLFFDPTGNGFLISPAANFLNARMTSVDAGLASGIDSAVADLPTGFTHRTLLVAGNGFNRLFDTWGSTLTTLHAKTRPSNDADLMLEKFGYWTDNGATYYYHFEPDLGYAGTLLAVKREFDQRGIALGYLQLDSWWYPKGPDQRWDDRAHGIYRYRAASDLFPDGLVAFQRQVGLPLATHARWIDPSSPYRGEYASSGNVITDARYWADVMAYLQAGGVVTYEQDWLGAQAQPVYDLSAPRQFMGNMASAAAQRKMTLQYCMALPRHALQTVEYANVTTMRVSDDRFDRNRWDTFLYTSRLAGALGVWPWADVFMSTERDNLLLATLSAGIVGIGDPLGAEDADSLRRVMRSDAVLVKPDAPLVPTDEAVLSEASNGPRAPMVAWTYSDHAGLRDVYVFAYRRSGVSADVSFSPASLGVVGAAYVYDYFADAGRAIGPGEQITTTLNDTTYQIVAPVGASGIAFLGDAGLFASLGQKRISRLADDGSVRATVEFAAGERALTLHGYAPVAPVAVAAGGSVDSMVYDPATQRFRMVLQPESTPSSVAITLDLRSAETP